MRGDIRREVSQDKLQKSAEKVRSAQLAVIKVLIYEAEPSRVEDEDKAAGTIHRLEEENEYWTTISGQEIIAIYSTGGNDDVIINRKKWWDFRPR